MNREFRQDRLRLLDAFLDDQTTRRISQQLRSYFDSVPMAADGQCPHSPAVYNFLPMVEVLLDQRAHVSGVVGATLLPTFCYARSYTHGERLAPHCDRPASEISVTVHLEGDCDWPIFFGHASTGTAPVTLKPGQAAIYLGCEVTHWRDPFPGQFYLQMTLHYVRSRGKYASACFDTRTPDINGIRY